MEIMKLRKICEEKEANLNERNKKMKELNIEVSSLKKVVSELEYTNVESLGKNHKIDLL